MRLKEINYSIKRNINLGDFEHFSSEFGAVAEIEEGEDEEKAMLELKKLCYSRLGSDYILWEDRRRANKVLREQGTPIFKKEIKKLETEPIMAFDE